MGSTAAAVSARVFAADLSVACNEIAAVAHGQRPNRPKVLAALRKLAAEKPPPTEQRVFSKFLANFTEVGKDIDSGHIAPLSRLVAQANQEASQLHAPACKIAWP